jgi:hypothetical protein
MKGDEPASVLAWNRHLVQGNRLRKVKRRIWMLKFFFLMLLRSLSIH